MNKQELLDELNKLLPKQGMESSYLSGARASIELAITLVEQLKEPEKVVIPKFVADHIEFCKSKNKRLNVALSESPESKMVSEMGVSWEEANETYVRAWLDGYEVEKEKLYYVINDTQQLMLANIGYAKPTLIGFEFVKQVGFLKKYQLTEKEIKEYDERYWTFAVEATE